MLSSVRICVAAVAFAAVGAIAVSEALAACAIAEGQGLGQSQSEAQFRARQDATAKAYQSGAAGATQIDYSDPACYFLDDGTNAINCQVQVSWCTTPAVAPQPPVHIQPVDPRPRRKIIPIFRIKPHAPHYHRGCRKFTAEASDYSMRGAQALVYRTLDNALRSRTGRSINSGGVRAEAPGCYYLGGHYARANIVQCRMTAEVCGW